MADAGWTVRHPDGTVEEAGILGENRARMLARRTGGVAIPPPATNPDHEPPTVKSCGGDRFGVSEPLERKRELNAAIAWRDRHKRH